MTSSPRSHTFFLDRPHGRLAYDDSAYDDTGRGPLVVCVPGMGDTRAEHRFLVPLLVEAGLRVVTLDLRGHGESSVDWDAYTPDAVGDDIVALLEHLDGGPAVVLGESMAAASAVWAAVEAPARVAGVVLCGPFVRDLPPTLASRLAPMLLRPGLWARFYRSLYKADPPDDLDEHAATLRTMLREPGRLAALKAMMRSSKADCEARLGDLDCPAVVVMGDADPDFPDPAAEAALVADRTSGRVVMVEGAGHYPHVEQPAVVAEEIAGLWAEVTGRG